MITPLEKIGQKNNSRMKVAYICYDNPYAKPMEGGKRGMLSRIAALSMCDIELDVYALTKPTEDLSDKEIIKEQQISNLFQFHMKKASPRMLASRWPICANKRFVQSVAKELEKHHYDCALYEGEQMMLYRVNECVDADRHVLYLLDIESEYRKQLAKSQVGLLSRSLQLREARGFRRFERIMKPLFDEYLFISIDELSQLEANLPKCTYAPYATTCISDKVIGSRESKTMVYVGDLSLESNFRSVLWFCERVLPNISKEIPNVKLEVIGRLSSANVAKLNALSCASNVVVKGYVDDLEEEYANAACVICPVLFGAGVKAKVIEGIGRGQIVIATTKAIEGTRLVAGKHVLVSDDEFECAKLCCDVLVNRDAYEPIAEQGLAFIRVEHSIERHKEIMLSAIEG